MALPGRKPMTIEPRLLVVEPGPTRFELATP